ncbi:hypothetical protein HU200_057366 [Digitaria exilis]|uniref:Uncharacterized protein n=1 Tax=Digitaria exilis TaxID=1010633 RepID=A0A835E4Z4_9POAL|nr:hypothetical protein HU200_057366 [Digitaria exilis]CAB3467519.1 unnamed protein product [Digitaria exilis]
MLLLQRHLLPLLRAASLFPSPAYHRACLLSNSTLASATPFSLEDYLVAACGLAPAQARKTAKKALDESSCSRGRLHSASNPDAIIALLSGVGLSRDDIAAVVVADPLLLRSSPKNIGPRLQALRDRHGLSAPQIVRFLLVGSRVLRNCDIGRILEFFIPLLSSFEQVLLLMKSNSRFLRSDLEGVKHNIALLRQCGLSARVIAHLCSRHLWILNFEPGRLNEIVLRAEELGVPRSSPMFSQAVFVAASNSKETVAAKLEFLKRTLGVCESEVSTAVSKMPTILGLSEECLLPKIQFLIKEVGFEPQNIVDRPILLGFSLEKRLMPRHRVMKALQAKGLLSSNMSFCSLLSYGEQDFKLRYIDCHKDSVPGLRMLMP